MSSPGRRASAAAHPKKRVFDVEYDPDEFEELEPDEEAADNNDGEDDSAEEAAVAPIRMSPRLKRYQQARSYLCYVTFLSRSHVPLTSRSHPAHVPLTSRRRPPGWPSPRPRKRGRGSLRSRRKQKHAACVQSAAR